MPKTKPGSLRVQSAGWPRLLVSLGPKTKVGAPSFAHFAKGGNLERMRDRVAEPQKLRRQHPCPPLQKTQGRGTLSTDGGHRHHQRAGHPARRGASDTATLSGNHSAWTRVTPSSHTSDHVRHRTARRRRSSLARFLLCAALSEGGFSSVGNLDPLRVRRGLGVVVVVPVPPLVRRASAGSPPASLPKSPDGRAA